MNRLLTRTGIGLIVIAGIFSSCKKELDLASTHLVPAADMWKVKNDARSAVFATYGLLRAALAGNNAYFAYGELRAGDFTSLSNSDLQAVATNNLDLSSSAMEDWKNWRSFYAAIAQANLCLEKLPTVAKNDFRYTPEEMSLDMANVRFVRALAYFYLARIWGNVPLIKQTAVGTFPKVETEDQQTVLDFATQDALTALAGLPWQYNGQSPEQTSNYWDQSGTFWYGIIASKGAAYDLLAHIAAWRGNYLDADKYATQALNNGLLGGYSIVPVATLTGTSSGVFGGQAADILFALPFSNQYQESSETGHIEDWVLGAPYINKPLPDIYIPNDTIIKIFNEPGDQRFSIDSNGVSAGDYFTGFGNPVPVFSKIRQLTISGDNPLQKYQSAIVIFRYEELVLLEAEAKLFLGNQSDAIQLLNSIREQRGLADFQAGSGLSAADAILQERRRELLGEGWRWFDLVRFERVPQYTRFTQSDVQSGAIFWPLSENVLSANSGLIQNQYWQH